MENDRLFAEERKIAIADYIKRNGKATVADLCDRFGVSGATIRNDLRELVQRRLIARTHGGAMVTTKTSYELDAKERGAQNSEAKRLIAKNALELIDDGDILVIDTGTTTLELARLLGQRKNLTVVTNDIQIALFLEDVASVNVVVVGGKVRKQFHCTVGVQGRTMLNGLTVDKAFMAANSFSLEKGATTPDIQQAEMKSSLLEIAARTILLVDGTKIGRNSFVQFAQPERIDCLITDCLDDRFRKSVEELGIEVRIANDVLQDG